MQLVIEQVGNGDGVNAITHLEDRVFRKEQNIKLAPLVAMPGQRSYRLLARVVSSGEPIGTISVVETPPDSPLLEQFGIAIPRGSNGIARYTRLAVLPEYRGQALSTRLILEAQLRLVAPAKIQHTWLLFDARQASNSVLCRLLGFQCGSSVIRSEYGRSRVLFRDETSIAAHNGNRRGWAYVGALAEPPCLAETETIFSPAFSMASGHAATAVPPAA